MRSEIVWLAHLCVEKGYLGHEECVKLREELGEDVEIVPFGKALLRKGHCPSPAEMKQLAADAWAHHQAGELPPSNPFEPPAADAGPGAELQWFAYNCLSMRLLDGEALGEAVARVESNVSIEDFHGVLLDLGLVGNEAAVSEQVEMAKVVAPAGPPPRNPFAGVEFGRATGDTPSPPAEPERPPETPKAEAVLKLRQPSPSTPPAASEPPPADTPAPRAQPSAGRAVSYVDPFQGTGATAAEVAEQAKAAYEMAARHAPEGEKKVNLGEAPEGRTFSIDVPEGFPAWESMAGLSGPQLEAFMIQALIGAQTEQASDLHLSADARPFMRKNGAVRYLSEHVLTAEESRALNVALLSAQQATAFDASSDLDFSLALDERNRFRVNLMVHKDGVAGTYRVVPNEIRSLEELGFPNAAVIEKLLTYHNGLVLVTGPVGSGKTTTLASLVDQLNRTREDHIITVEEPVEVVQRSSACSVTQREVGMHTQTFQSALKGALRQDPDIIVIGEMRDLETIEMAISASETGHLVIGTMHTSDAATTLNRLLDVFPPAQQSQIRAMVAESLRGIICQRLLPARDGSLVLACELLLNNLAVGAMINEGKVEGLGNVMETGKRQGMIQMDASIMKLWEEGRIDDDVAFANVRNSMLRRRIRPPKAPEPKQPEAEEPKKKRKFF